MVPNSVVFVGTVEKVDKGEWASTITFEVYEVLWGLPAATKSVTVSSDGLLNRGDQRLVIAPREQDGKLSAETCRGMMLGVDDDWARECRRLIKSRAFGALPIHVSGAGEEGARATIRSGGRTWTATVDTSGNVLFDRLPHGSYSVHVEKPGYVTANSGPLSVRPGGRGWAPVLLLIPDGRIHGRIIDHAGVPAANVERLSLVAWDPAANRSMPSGSHFFDTDARGEFAILGVAPGVYYLGANIWSETEPSQCTLPRAVYPGVRSFRNAALIRIESGENREIIFHLPDFGKKRHLTIRVKDAKDAPVSGAVIVNAAPSGSARPTASVPELKTGPDGTASFEIWSSAEIRDCRQLRQPGRRGDSRPPRSTTRLHRSYRE